MDTIVTELKLAGWTATKGRRYSVPYIRISRTGFLHAFQFARWGFPTPNSIEVPTRSRYWAWSAIPEHKNPDSSIYVWEEEHVDINLHRGVINSLGTRFESLKLLDAIFLVLNDPCLITNSFASAKGANYAQSICPVCNPPNVRTKVYSDGIFPEKLRILALPNNDNELRNELDRVFVEGPIDNFSPNSVDLNA
jgi:hypothetical protein